MKTARTGPGNEPQKLLGPRAPVYRGFIATARPQRAVSGAMSLTFPPVAEGDLAGLIELLTSDRWPFHLDVEPTPASVEANLAHFQPSEAQAPHWIELADERIGLVVLRELDDPTPVFDLRLKATHRRRGLGRATLAWLARETFEAHGKHRLEGHTRADNRPMQRLFARTPGWVLEGCFRQTWRDREAGIWRDALAYGLLAEDWRRGSETPLSQPLAG